MANAFEPLFLNKQELVTIVVQPGIISVFDTISHNHQIRKATWLRV
jgi:hypothetical protein